MRFILKLKQRINKHCELSVPLKYLKNQRIRLNLFSKYPGFKFLQYCVNFMSSLIYVYFQSLYLALGLKVYPKKIFQKY